MRMRCWGREPHVTELLKDDAGESRSEGGSRLPSRALRRHCVSIQLDPADPLHGRDIPRRSGTKLLPSQLQPLGPHDHHAARTVSMRS